MIPSKLIDAIEKYTQLSYQARKVLCDMIRSSHELEVSINDEDIAKRVGIIPRIVNEIIQQLIELGYINKIGRDNSKTYMLCQQKLLEIMKNG